jgi:hypothetical protein
LYNKDKKVPSFELKAKNAKRTCLPAGRKPRFETQKFFALRCCFAP